MNDKTREQIEAMKKQTIGVEIEMNNITREKAARKVADYFGTTAWYAAAQYGYMSWAFPMQVLEGALKKCIGKEAAARMIKEVRHNASE